MNFSPYEMHILLDVYVGGEVSVKRAAPIFAQTMDKLCERELVRRYSDEQRPEGCEWAPTEKLNVLMYHILSAPDPVWSMP